MSFPKYQENRSAKVEWLGDIPRHWKVAPVKAVATCNDDVLTDASDPKYEIFYVEISDVEYQRGVVGGTTLEFGQAPSRARRRVLDGDVILSTVRTYLRAIAHVSRPTSNMIVSTGFCVIRPRTIFGRYLGYVAQSEYFVSRVISQSVGVSYPAINASDVMRIPIPVPPVQEQQLVAAFLDRETAKIDVLIEEQRRLIELLQEKRQAVISHAVTKGLDPDAPMKDSGIEWLGQVPAHWEVTPLKRITSEITVGIVVEPSKYYSDHGVPALRSLNVRPGRIVIDDMIKISFEAHELLSKSALRAGDVVIVRTGQPGTAAVVPLELDNCNCIDLIVVRKPVNGREDFLCWFLASDAAIRQFSEGSGGAIQQHFNVGMAKALSVLWPPPQEQRMISEWISDKTSAIDQLIGQAEGAIDLLLERRAALISAAVTGKIDVRALAPAASEAA